MKKLILPLSLLFASSAMAANVDLSTTTYNCGRLKHPAEVAAPKNAPTYEVTESEAGVTVTEFRSPTTKPGTVTKLARQFSFGRKTIYKGGDYEVVFDNSFKGLNVQLKLISNGDWSANCKKSGTK